MLELAPSFEQLLDRVELARRQVSGQLEKTRRSELGQFLTPRPIARYMASLFANRPSKVRLLEAGAGVGSLLGAFAAAACGWDELPAELDVTAYEIDSALASSLRQTMQGCRSACEEAGIRFRSEVREQDFIAAAVEGLGGRFGKRDERFNATILNPPYRKIHSDSEARCRLRSLGIETGNLYTGFLALAVKLLEPGGEMVAITPRSFCNGPYFRPFRELFLGAMTVRRVHVFEGRKAFRDDDVLQENIIIHAVKNAERASVFISTSAGPEAPVTERKVSHDELVHPEDPERFLHIVPDADARRVAVQMQAFSTTLPELGLGVSTGRVVDFRAKEHLRKEPTARSAPLIYPGHLVESFVEWPREGFKKPNALAVAPETEPLMLPKGIYVVVKRFSAKEERRRLVAAIYDPARVDADRVGFENHLNVFHVDNEGLPAAIARGLAVFLNSTLVDQYFRQFNGHTQVNATDLRSLKYPSREQLLRLGKGIGKTFPAQGAVDARMAEILGPPQLRS